MQLDALILDFDGTILDTETPTYSVWREAYHELGETLDLEVWEKALGSFGRFDPWRHLLSRVGPRRADPRLVDRIERQILELCHKEQLRPGVTELLDDAKRSGVRLAVASSSSRLWVEGWLTKHCVRSYFNEVVARDDVDRVKPAPDLYLATLRKLDVDAGGCLVVEDSPAGVLAATRAGVRCIAVLNPVTRALSFPGANLVLSTLAGPSLADLLGMLTAAVDCPVANRDGLQSVGRAREVANALPATTPGGRADYPA